MRPAPQRYNPLRTRRDASAPARPDPQLLAGGGRHHGKFKARRGSSSHPRTSPRFYLRGRPRATNRHPTPPPLSPDRNFVCSSAAPTNVLPCEYNSNHERTLESTSDARPTGQGGASGGLLEKVQAPAIAI